MGQNTEVEQNITPTELDEFYKLSEKIQIGMKRAWRKLVIESAAKDQSLVIKVNGEIKTVPAKELLAGLEE